MFQKLAVLAQILFWETDGGERFYDEQAVLIVVESDLVNGAAGYDEVIAI